MTDAPTEAREELLRRLDSIADAAVNVGRPLLPQIADFVLARERAAAEKARAETIERAAVACLTVARESDPPTVMIVRAAVSQECMRAIRALAQPPTQEPNDG